jgi:hypothetical protein
MNKAQENSERSSGELKWSKYTGVCRMCRRRFRISEQFIADQRENYGRYAGTDEDLANTAEWCIECATGEEAEGEIVESEA